MGVYFCIETLEGQILLYKRHSEPNQNTKAVTAKKQKFIIPTLIPILLFIE